MCFQPCLFHAMSSTVLARVSHRLANLSPYTLTVSVLVPVPVPAVAAIAPQAYATLHHSPRCLAGPRLPWAGPYTHIRSTHTYIPHSVTTVSPWRQQTRAFACGAVLQLKKNQNPPRPKVLEEDIEENFVKGRWVAFYSPTSPLSLSLPLLL